MTYAAEHQYKNTNIRIDCMVRIGSFKYLMLIEWTVSIVDTVWIAIKWQFDDCDSKYTMLIKWAVSNDYLQRRDAN